MSKCEMGGLEVWWVSMAVVNKRFLQNVDSELPLGKRYFENSIWEDNTKIDLIKLVVEL
jgi:hypothetical protein